jgi:hypothetical protein
MDEGSRLEWSRKEEKNGRNECALGRVVLIPLGDGISTYSGLLNRYTPHMLLVVKGVSLLFNSNMF